ncbi:MAG: hypothetical protein RL204_434 [Bacteroidota bacterium]|jgi:hypothetical protein
MSQDYKSFYQQMKDNAAETSNENDAKATEHYPSPSNTRNIIFEWADGRKLFLNYAFLISCELSKDNDRVILTFTNCTIHVDGIKLQLLFDQLNSQIVRVVKETNSRYAQLESEQAVIKTISMA